jgi:two-component system sensor histidine kinase CpxA
MMTRPRIPLYGQILFWFFLNLTLVAGVLLLVLKVQFRMKPEALLAGRTAARFEAAATFLAADLRESAREEWDEIVSMHETRNAVRIAVYLPDGDTALAGRGEELPPELFEAQRAVIRAGRPTAPGARRGPPRAPARGGMRATAPRPGARAATSGDEAGAPPGLRVARVFYVGKSRRPSVHRAAAMVSLGSRDFRHPPDGMVVASSSSLSNNAVFFDWRPWLWALGGILLVSALVWLPFVHRLTKRLGHLTSAAETMAGGDFAVQVASSRGDELGRLSRAVQSMAGRLDDYVRGQRRFMGDIAHELCSPLARLRMAIGVLESGIPESDRHKLDTLNEEAEELGLLVNELLDFSRASLKPESLPTQEVALADLLAELAGREGGGAELRLIADPALSVTTNRDLLRRGLGNVVRNAVRYAGEAGPIELKATPDGGEILIAVRDRGPGIPPEWLEKIFEPFSRPERARTREGGGAGLGLAIAKTCVGSLGGTISARNRSAGGLAVEIRIPQIP